MVNAPAGGQAGAARCGHRAKCFWLGGSGMQRSLMAKKIIDPQPCREWFEAAARGKAKTPRHGEEFSSLCAPPLRPR